MKKIRSYLIAALAVAAVVIQFVPVEKSNPPVTREIRWDSPETAALARRACYDCHSHETTWPWYASVAPVSWRVTHHVNHGREYLNFSTWDRPNEDLDEVIEVLQEDEMPLKDYRLMHGEARLTDAEVERLIAGFRATFAADPPVARRR